MMIETGLYDDGWPSENATWYNHNWSQNELNFVEAYLRHHNASRAYREMVKLDEPDRRLNSVECEKGGKSMMREKAIKSYIEHKKIENRERLQLNRDRTGEEIAALAMSNMIDFITVQPDGSAYTDLSGLTREQFAAISEITTETYVEGRGEHAREVKTVKIKLHPKAPALKMLGDHLGMFRAEEPNPDNGMGKKFEVELIDPTPDESQDGDQEDVEAANSISEESESGEESS